MQPVLIQSFVDEFNLPEGETLRTPAVPGQILRKVEEEHELPDNEKMDYQLGVGKLLHLMRWSQPGILHAV